MKKQGKPDSAAKRASGKKQGGLPRHVPTDASRGLVQGLSIAGWRQDDIAPLVGCSERTLRTHYKKEIGVAVANVHAQVARTIVMRATGGGGPDAWKDADIIAAIFYAKTRMGWREEPQRHDHSGAIGQYDLSKLSDAELDRFEALLARVTVAGSISPRAGEAPPQGGSGARVPNGR